MYYRDTTPSQTCQIFMPMTQNHELPVCDVRPFFISKLTQLQIVPMNTLKWNLKRTMRAEDNMESKTDFPVNR